MTRTAVKVTLGLQATLIAQMLIPKKANASQRLKRLLEAGYFPDELPPPFISRDLGRYRAYLKRTWPAQQLAAFKSDPETISIPRFGRARRRLSIVNPINYFNLSSLIASEWQEIRTHLIKSKVSEFKPIFDVVGERSLYQLDFLRVEARINKILANYHHSIKSDVARFYPAIYTHSIAWALYGKSYCKIEN